MTKKNYKVITLSASDKNDTNTYIYYLMTQKAGIDHTQILRRY